MMRFFRRNRFVKYVCLIAISGCTVGPDYVRPEPFTTGELPRQFKENWKVATPQKEVVPPNWWQLFSDHTLNELMMQVQGANLTLIQAQANYKQAAALVANATAAYFPNLTHNLSVNRAKNLTTGIKNNASFTMATLWEANLWGHITRTVEAQENTALSSFYNVAATLLSLQSQVAQNYFQLRLLDAQKDLLNKTISDYKKVLSLTKAQYRAGIVAMDSVHSAEAQLASTEAQAIDLGVARAQFEHAIAILIGQPPHSFSISVIPLEDAASLPLLPRIPASLPSDLLEKRPDIRAAEYTMAAANAQIGVARAAYFPNLTFTATGGYQSNHFAHWLSTPNRIWSLGPALATTLFDGGATKAINQQALANYDATVANYRQTILTAFKEVEDNLAALRILEEESFAQHQATTSAKQALAITDNQYKAGTVNYLNVLTAQNTALSNERADLNIMNARLLASVKLIIALGGGWQHEP